MAAPSTAAMADWILGSWHRLSGSGCMEYQRFRRAGSDYLWEYSADGSTNWGQQGQAHYLASDQAWSPGGNVRATRSGEQISVQPWNCMFERR